MQGFSLPGPSATGGLYSCSNPNRAFPVQPAYCRLIRSGSHAAGLPNATYSIIANSKNIECQTCTSYETTSGCRTLWYTPGINGKNPPGTILQDLMGFPGFRGVYNLQPETGILSTSSSDWTEDFSKNIANLGSYNFILAGPVTNYPALHGPNYSMDQSRSQTPRSWPFFICGAGGKIPPLQIKMKKWSGNETTRGHELHK